MSAKRSEKLFLHFGPGGNAAVEREWHGSSLPIDWWDQPRFGQDETGTYARLIDACESKLLEASRGGAIDLLAHSFGGSLADELASRHPEQVRSITLLASAPSPLEAFRNVAEALLQRAPADALLGALSSLRSTPSFETLFGLIGALLSTPGFMDIYWPASSSAAKARYGELASRIPTLDMGTFTSVLRDLFNHPAPTGKSRYDGPVTLIVGAQDPAAPAEKVIPFWRARFPGLRLKMVEAGHYIHFETPASEWA